MSFWKKLEEFWFQLSEVNKCESCGKIMKSWQSLSIHEVFCKDEVLGYDWYNEKFAESSRIYYFNTNYKGMKP